MEINLQVDENDLAKLGIVLDYLWKHFPGSCVWSKLDEAGTRGENFTVETARGEIYRARASRSFLSDLSAEEIAERLSEWDLAAVLIETARNTSVLINRTGIKLEVAAAR